MKMSEEMAIKLHRMMWSDMQKELGDTPDLRARNKFKEKWCAFHFPDDHISFNCFLCDYCGHSGGNKGCNNCPVEWPDSTCSSAFGQPPVKTDYRFAPISEILALPTRNKELTYENAAYKVGSYYEFREQLLSKASGRPASTAIDDHVKAIQKKAVAEYREEQAANNAKAGRDYAYTRVMKKLSEASGLSSSICVEDHVKNIQENAVQQSNLSKIYGDTKMELAKASGLPAADETIAHIKAIQEKAVDDYFAKMPLAKAITMDVDDAFKQYSKEQKAPIFHALAEASGLTANNESISEHISAIKKTVALNQLSKDVNTLKSLTGLSYLTVESFGSAFKAKIEDASVLKDLLNKYKDRLYRASGIDRDKPIDAHLSKIYSSGYTAGKSLAKEEMLKKIEEVLKS